MHPRNYARQQNARGHPQHTAQWGNQWTGYGSQPQQGYPSQAYAPQPNSVYVPHDSRGPRAWHHAQKGKKPAPSRTQTVPAEAPRKAKKSTKLSFAAKEFKPRTTVSEAPKPRAKKRSKIQKQTLGPRQAPEAPYAPAGYVEEKYPSTREHVHDQRAVSEEVEETDSSALEINSRGASGTSLDKTSDESSLMNGSAAQGDISGAVKNARELTAQQRLRHIEDLKQRLEFFTDLDHKKTLEEQGSSQPIASCGDSKEGANQSGDEEAPPTPRRRRFRAHTRYEKVPGVHQDHWRCFKKTFSNPVMNQHYLLPAVKGSKNPRIAELRWITEAGPDGTPRAGTLRDVFLAKARRALQPQKREYYLKCGHPMPARIFDQLVDRECYEMMKAAFEAENGGPLGRDSQLEKWGQTEMLGFFIVSGHTGLHDGLGKFKCFPGRGIFLPRKEITFLVEKKRTEKLERVTYACNWTKLEKMLKRRNKGGNGPIAEALSSGNILLANKLMESARIEYRKACRAKEEARRIAAEKAEEDPSVDDSEDEESDNSSAPRPHLDRPKFRPYRPLESRNEW